MKIKEIRLLSDSLPTIIDLDGEIFLIENLIKIQANEIASSKEDFYAIASKIQESHNDNGIFEITEENYSVFRDFCDWLRFLQPKLKFDVLNFIDGLNISPEEIKNRMNKNFN